MINDGVWTRRGFLKAAALAGSIGLSGCISNKSQLSAEQPNRPNILFIIADDLGWKDVGYHGSEIMTPHIDQLAKEGRIFDQHYVMASCSPTRCGLLTGYYPSRFGLLGPTNSHVLPSGYRTLASVLKEAGYETYLNGKWHLGSTLEAGPHKYGFDHSYGSLAGGVTSYGHRYEYGPYSKTWHRNGLFVDDEGHVTDLIGQQTVADIHRAASRNKPFFIYVPFTAPHHPIEEEQKWVDLYEGRIQNPSRKLYAACVTHMDAVIGDILEALEKTDQRRNTLVVFTSDNGAERSYQVAGRSREDRYPGIPDDFQMPVQGSNRDLKGWKHQLYEGGIRVPALVNWPGTLNPGRIQPPVHIVDWFPTFCTLAGSPLSDEVQLDGKNIWPWISGQKTKITDRTLYWKTPGQTALREGDWKLILNHAGNPKIELYDLKNDPFEKHNAAADHAERVTRLSTLIEQERGRDEQFPVKL